MATVVKPTAEEIAVAAEQLRGIVLPTPLVPFGVGDGLDELLLKPEVLQPAGSFKIRGIFHAVSCLSPEERGRGLSTVSAGNTAKALAWAGRHFEVTARSLMPEGAPQTKIDAVKALGGTPILVPTEEVFRFLKEEGWLQEPYAFIHPWIERNVMIGHGTLGREIVEQCPDVDTVFIPVGGGGLMGGVGSALKAAKPSVRIVAVEPESCPALSASLKAGRPQSVACNTICDGVAVPYMTEQVFPLLQELVDDLVLVTEAEVRQAIRRLVSSAHIVAEGAGALATAAALKVDARQRGKTVCLVTGGSIDREKLAAILM